MRRILVAVLGLVIAIPLNGDAQNGTATTSAEPFKVGTFRIGTLRHKVEAAPAPVQGTGSFLPPNGRRKPGQ